MNKFRCGLVVCLLFSFCSAIGFAQDNAQSFTVSNGEVEGALFSVVKANQWNNQLLLIAHGHRDEHSALSADIDVSRDFYSELVSNGWMVAITSYRRNGVIVTDAIKDLNNLNAHIEQVYGAPQRTLLMGDSMGGAIGVLIAENFPDDYDGILAIGAALQVNRYVDAFKLKNEPRIPVLFLTNQSEMKEPSAYVQATQNASVVPALWRVARDGHVNVNDAERLAALQALNQYVETGSIDFEKDGTISGQFLDSTAELKNGRAVGEITSISNVYGNVFTSFVADDLLKLGIEPMSHFQLVFGDHKVSVFWGINYGDVKAGEWVAFISGEGNLMVAVNMGDACAATECKVGDSVSLLPR